MKKHDYKGRMRGLERAKIEQMIDAYVLNQRDRKVIKLALLNDISYTNIAGRLDLEVSSRTVQEIMNRWMPIIMEHL
ncbi:MAG: hypothetical protein J6K55_12345 [Clostridia bacterium]|nr:hypothetical protein [Clostridia bacterium]